MEKGIIPQSDAIALYNVYRDYVKHENTLMNVRMTWFLTTQAFLFSSYALLNQKRISAGNFELIRSWQEFIGGITDVEVQILHPDADLFFRILCRAPFLHFCEGGFPCHYSVEKQVGCGIRSKGPVHKSAGHHRRRRRQGQGRGVGFRCIPSKSRHGDMGPDRDHARLFAPRIEGRSNGVAAA